MPLTNGCNHVTILTSDLDRLIAFYRNVFDAEIRLDLTEGGLRHALVDLGGGFCLHPFEVAEGTPHDTGLPRIFQRGHIDHIALNMPDAEAYATVRRRLVDAGASKGRIRDFGAVQVTVFEDPDGMEAEIALWKTGEPLSMAESHVEEMPA